MIRGNGAVFTGTSIRLPGGANAAYVDLPNHLISNLDNVTVEIWWTMTGVHNWSRLWDLGSTVGGEVVGVGGGGVGRDFWFYAPNVGTNISQQGVSLKNLDPVAPGGGTGPVGNRTHDSFTNLATSLNREYHVAAVWRTDGNTGGTMTIYRDGTRQASVDTSFGPKDLNDVNNWLGRSNFTFDPMFQGEFNEFRIYDVALTANEIAASLAAGPNADLDPTDSDGDEMPDSFENQYPFLDPNDPADATLDEDGDGLNNLGEFQQGTDPEHPDTDNDTLTDGDEVMTHGTDPLDPDSDGDALEDGDEINTHLTDPLNPDSDGDRALDGDEIAAGTDPNDPSDFPRGAIIAPVSATSQCGGNATNLINQSGLSSPYQSGVTRFDSYITTATHVDGSFQANWVSDPSALPCALTFDLGSETSIDKIALWNVNSSTTIGEFSVYSDADSDFSGGSPALPLGSFVANRGTSPQSPAQVFAFQRTKSRWIHVLVTSSTGGDDRALAGEIAFREAAEEVLDTDGDGLEDRVETNTGVYVDENDTGTDPENPDTDGDGVPDGKEVQALGDPHNNDDTDGDGIDNLEETSGTLNSWIGGEDTGSPPGETTDPCDADSDDDTLNDGDEILNCGTDPNQSDSDRDGLTDAEETSTHLTDPLNEDTDGDGFRDSDEVAAGTDPRDENDFPGSVIIAPTAVMPSCGEIPVSPAVNLINQSGLSSPYSSGVTRFDVYTATAVHPPLWTPAEWSTSSSSSCVLTFDLGLAYQIDKIAIWNVRSSRSIRGFSVYSDGDQEYLLGAPAQLLGSFTAANGTNPESPAQIFSFPETRTQWVHVVITSNEGSTGLTLGEVAFSATEPETADRDGDGLPNEVETNTGIWVSAADTGTDPDNPDTDGDGLLDGIESCTGVFLSPQAPGTDPNKDDTDGDAFFDGEEVAEETDPNDPTEFPRGVVLAPISATSGCGENSLSPVINLINQTGLEPLYERGVTNFRRYVAGATHTHFANSDLWLSHGLGTPCALTFDLGSEANIDRIALWNTESSGSVRGFSLYRDGDSIYEGGASQQLLGSFTAQNGTRPSSSSQVFSFAPTTTRWVHLVITSSGGGRFLNLGEVAFRSQPNPSDRDGDGLLDSVETNTGIWVSAEDTGTDPDNPDTDNDGLEDGAEVNDHRTSPLNADTDGDGSGDGEEVAAGTDPLNPTDWFRILDVAHEAGQTTIRWSSVPGKRYRVKVGTNLVSFGNVAGAEEVHAAAAPAKETMFTDSVERGAEAYYVVEVLED